ncbi:lipoprotein [Spiroplasma endosymbiont of Ammophila pubescens]|uniref:lipoprotein n=1 Tax=Spiroplasma endosymbiont of Ammophila pubescens TaxID=3066315 RepID=UPI003D6CCDD9
MKKIISILGAIGLTTTSTTSLISCEKPNNNENGGNKPEPSYIPFVTISVLLEKPFCSNFSFI